MTETRYEVTYYTEGRFGTSLYNKEIFTNKRRAVEFAQSVKEDGAWHIHVYERTVTEIEF